MLGLSLTRITRRALGQDCPAFAAQLQREGHLAVQLACRLDLEHRILFRAIKGLWVA